jgi:vacuolar-type H+-ATPase subunit E/Vma4
MSVTNIVRQIEAETAVEIGRRLAEADERAAVVQRRARDAVRARVAAEVARAEPAIRAESARRVNAARQRLRDRRAELALDATAAVYAVAREQLDAIAGGAEPERWANALHALLDETLELVGPEPTVRLRDGDADAVVSRVRAVGGRVERLPGESPAGLVAQSSDGRIEVDATIGIRLDRAHARLAEWLAGQLGLGA